MLTANGFFFLIEALCTVWQNDIIEVTRVIVIVQSGWCNTCGLGYKCESGRNYLCMGGAHYKFGSPLGMLYRNTTI